MLLVPRRWRSAVALLSITLLAACGGEDNAPTTSNQAQTPAGNTTTPGMGTPSTPTTTGTGSALLNWYPPTQNTDGSPLRNLSGYRIYWGTTQGAYSNSVTINNPGLASYVVEQLTPARWFFSVTALNSSGIESGFSNVASKTVQ